MPHKEKRRNNAAAAASRNGAIISTLIAHFYGKSANNVTEMLFVPHKYKDGTPLPPESPLLTQTTLKYALKLHMNISLSSHRHKMKQKMESSKYVFLKATF